jgi:hypothetical protein
MISATLAVGLACIGTAAIAHGDEQLVELDNGFAAMAIVAHSPAEFANAQREARMMEARRQWGLGPLTIVAQAIDEPSRIVATPPITAAAVAAMRCP